MDHHFSWDGQHQVNAESLSSPMVFSNDHHSGNLESNTFGWSQDDQTVWNVPEACPPKRLKLENTIQNDHEKTGDASFQHFYLTSCFQTPGDPTKDICGFSYLPQSYLCK